MENKRRDAEYSLPPPEFTEPAREFRNDPEPEYTPLPPEYGQRTTAPSGEPVKRRKWRKLLAVPALLLLSFLCLRTGGATTPGAVKPSAAPAELKRGSVMIDVNDYYTGVEGDTLNYRYMLYNSAVEENCLSDLPWPIAVTAVVTDEDGNTVESPENPDVWTMGRSLDEHAIDVKGLRGNLLLRLRAEYEQDGEQRQTTVYVPFSRNPGVNTPVIEYAMLDPATRRVTFDYWVDRNFGGALIVPVDATVIDSQGRTAHPPVNPVMWSSGPIDEDSKWADATDLNDDLTLLLRTTYEDVDGKTYSFTAARQVVIIGRSTEFEDPRLDTLATIDSITKTDVSFTAAFKTTHESGSHFDMTVYQADLVWLDEKGEEVYRDYLSAQNVRSEMSFAREKSPPWGEWPDWTFTYNGRHYFLDETCYRYDADAVERAKTVYVELTVYNRYTGREYTIQSDPVPKPEFNYPLGDGEIVLTVYNDTTTFEFPSYASSDSYLTVLEQKTFPEASFSAYKLPGAMTPSGYSFAGWVIHVGNPFDEGASSDPFQEYNGDPPVDTLLGDGSFAFAVGSTLTKEDIERVPPSADGKRYVNVHAVWIKDHPSTELLLLDDGNGNVKGYDMEIPLASEGYLYLCRYPVPDHDPNIWTFDGWYDADGNRVDMLVCFFSFTPMTYDESGGFTGYDWSAGQQPVTLYAHWK